MNRDSSFSPSCESRLFLSSPSFLNSFFFSSRSLRLALIPYLIGSDLINFSENAIKRPPGFPRSRLRSGYHLVLTLYSDPEAPPRPFQSKYSNERTNLHPLRRIAFYNRELLPPACSLHSLHRDGGGRAARRALRGWWTNSETCKRRKSSSGHVLFVCVKRKKERVVSRYRQEFFLWRVHAKKNSRVLARRLDGVREVRDFYLEILF